MPSAVTDNTMLPPIAITELSGSVVIVGACITVTVIVAVALLSKPPALVTRTQKAVVSVSAPVLWVLANRVRTWFQGLPSYSLPASSAWLPKTTLSKVNWPGLAVLS